MQFSRKVIDIHNDGNLSGYSSASAGYSTASGGYMSGELTSGYMSDNAIGHDSRGKMIKMPIEVTSKLVKNTSS